MIFIAALILALANIAWATHVTLWGGVGYYIPALLIIAASAMDIPLLVLLLVVLGVTQFYVPLTMAMFLGIVSISLLANVIFRVWIHDDTLWIRVLVTGGLISLFILLIHFSTNKSLGSETLGSLVLTLPVLALWYMRYSQKGRLV